MNPSIQALFESGVGLHRAGRLAEAEATYRAVLQRDPRHGDAAHCLAVICSLRADWRGAIGYLDAALAANPQQPMVHFRRGVACLELGRTDEALRCCERAIALDPGYAEALLYRGHLLFKTGRWHAALDDLDRAIAAEEIFDRAIGERYLVKAHLCDWRSHAQDTADLMQRCHDKREIAPLIALAAADDPLAHRQAASVAAAPSADIAPRKTVPHARLRVAYLSPDFYDHVVAHQIIRLIAQHDKTRFETYGICLQRAPHSPIRTRLRETFDHFIECGGRSDGEVAAILAGLQIDIAVDLAGYTERGRQAIFAQRPAPVAVAYLGYPGTTGASYIDYLMADATVIPATSEEFYSEKIARLPECFFPSDPVGRMVAPPPSRQEAGLPEEGFVFCAFNHPNKITP